MTTIILPPEVEGALAEEAKRQGVSPQNLAVETLRRHFLPPNETVTANGKTLADFLEGYVGTVEGSKEPLSEDCGRRFAEGMAEKQGRGKL